MKSASTAGTSRIALAILLLAFLLGHVSSSELLASPDKVQLRSADQVSPPFNPTQDAHASLLVEAAVRTTDGLASESSYEASKTRFYLNTTCVFSKNGSTMATVTKQTPIVPPFQFVDLPVGNGAGTKRFVRAIAVVEWNGRTAGGACAADGTLDARVDVEFVREKDTGGGTKSKQVDRAGPLAANVVVRGTAPVLSISPASGFITREATVSVSGEVSTLLPVTVKVADQTAPAMNGFYSAVVSLAEGPTQVTVTATDCAGRSASGSILVVRDSVSPVAVVTEPAHGSATSAATPRLRVSYSDPAPSSSLDLTTLKITLDGSDVTASFTVGQTEATFTPTTPLADGDHVLAVTVKDRAGNASAPASSTFAVDTIAPTLTLSPVTGAILASGQVTFVADYSDSGSGVLLTSFTGTLNGQPATFTVGASQATFTPSLALADGSHTVVVSIRDRAGNGATAQTAVLVDSTKPALSLSLAPASGSFTGSARPTFTATYQDSGSGVDLSGGVVGTLDGTSIAFAAGSSTATFTPTADLSEAVHELQLSVKDKAGNSSGPVTLSFTIDLTPPLLVLSPSADKTVTTTRPALTATYGDPGSAASGLNLASYQASLDNVSITTASTIGPIQATFTPATPLSPGNHVFQAQVADNVGHVVSAESQFAIAPPVQPTNAGSAVGVVVDAASGAPIPGATISTPALGITTSTNSQGLFVLSVPEGPTDIDVAQAGYEGPIRRFVNVVAGREEAVATVALYRVDSSITHVRADVGGTATNSAGTIAIALPPGSLPRDVDLTVTPLSDPRAVPPDPPRGTLPGQAFVVSPHGLTLTQPVTVTMTNALGLSPGHRLLLYAFNPVTGAWDIAGPGIVGSDGSSITGTTTHLTLFAFG